jgi:hypothetical protein
MRATLRLAALVAGVGGALLPSSVVRAQLLITGNDEKVSFDENTGKTITHPSGKDTVSRSSTSQILLSRRSSSICR